MAIRMSQDIRQQESPPIVVGIDVGQRIDPTTIVVAEAIPRRRESGATEHEFEVRHLERLPLGTAYPDVAARVVDVVRKLASRPVSAYQRPPAISLVVDVTGVGRPVVDAIRAALDDHGFKRVTLSAATFTHGTTITGRPGSREIRVGKAGLVSRLQVLFQEKRVKMLSSHPEAAVMTRELMDYEIKTDPEGDAKFGAFKVGSHDDLVTALGLAALFEPRTPGRLVGM